MEIGVLVDVLLTVGLVVLAWYRYRRCDRGRSWLVVRQHFVSTLFTRRLEYVIVGCDATATVEFCAGLPKLLALLRRPRVMAFPPVIGVPEALPTCKVWTDVQRVWCLNIVALSKVTEIVASNPCDIEKRVAFFTVYTAAITAFECSHTDGVDDSSVFHLYRLLSYRLHRLDLRLLSSLKLWAAVPAEFAVAAL